MTLALVILAGLAVFVAAALRRSRSHRAWRDERERIAAYDERRAACNGHPHTGDVMVSPRTRHEDRQP